jgi:hypothetical protein
MNRFVNGLALDFGQGPQKGHGDMHIGQVLSNIWNPRLARVSRWILRSARQRSGLFYFPHDCAISDTRIGAEESSPNVEVRSGVYATKCTSRQPCC